MTTAAPCAGFLVSAITTLGQWRVSCPDCGWSEVYPHKRQATGAGFRHIRQASPPHRPT
jgi:hypothetical protein